MENKEKQNVAIFNTSKKYQELEPECKDSETSTIVIWRVVKTFITRGLVVYFFYCVGVMVVGGLKGSVKQYHISFSRKIFCREAVGRTV